MEAHFLLLLVGVCGFTYLDASAKSLAPTAVKLSTESINELQHLKFAYKQTVKEELALGDLKNSLRRKLLIKNSNYLADLLCGGDSAENRHRIHHYLVELPNDFEMSMAETILHGATNLANSCSSFNQTVHVLSYALPEDDKNLFEFIAIFYCHIYDVINNGPALRLDDTNFWPAFAFGLYKLKEHKLYPLMSVKIRSQIDTAITNLPNNCHYLFFRPHYCLMNKRYEEYIYITIMAKTIDSTSRHVWGWHDKQAIDDMGPLKATILQTDANSRNTTNILVQLQGIKNPLYYYMMPQTNLVAAWELPTEPANSIWSIEFLDEDRVALYQQEYIACFTDEKYDQERRMLKGYSSDKYSLESSECQWLLGTCNRKETL